MHRPPFMLVGVRAPARAQRSAYDLSSAIKVRLPSAHLDFHPEPMLAAARTLISEVNGMDQRCQSGAARIEDAVRDWPARQQPQRPAAPSQQETAHGFEELAMVTFGLVHGACHGERVSGHAAQAPAGITPPRR